MKIFKHNIKRTLTNKFRLGIIIILPLIFVSLFVFNSYGTIVFGIVDNDQTELTQSLITQLEENRFIEVKKYSEEDLIANIITYQVDYGIIIEKDFTNSLINEHTIEIKDYYFIESVNVYNAKHFIESYLENIKTIATSVDGDHRLFYQALADFNNNQYQIINLSDTEGKIAQAIASIGFIVYFIIFLPALTCGMILEDKKNGTLARVFNTPMTLKRYLFESLLSFLVILVIQVFILMLVFRFVFDFYFNNGFIELVTLLICFGISSIALGLLVVSLVKTPIQMYLTMGIIATPMSMLGGVYWPIDMMPEVLQNVGMLMPTSWMMKGAQEIIRGGNFTDIFANLGIILLFAIAFFVAGIIKKKDFAKA